MESNTSNKPLTSSSISPTIVNLKVASRQSALAKAQVREVESELQQYISEISLHCTYLHTYGDRDRTTSLRLLGKTDFFTRELDELVLAGTCDVAIHSAKDLPEPLPEGLTLIALTRGVDSSDSLVLEPTATLESLPPRALIATSSARREEAVSALRSDLAFTDVRGTIEERLAKVYSGEVSGVVVATAALIRLKLTGVNAIRLPGETVPMQGRLAIVARSERIELRELFAPLHFV